MKKSIRVEIEEKLHHQLKIKAAVTGTTVADFVREALRKWVEEEHPIVILPKDPVLDRQNKSPNNPTSSS